MLVLKLIYYDEKSILLGAHQVKIIGLNFEFRTLYNLVDGMKSTWWPLDLRNYHF
jgi:hypothetical protein